MFKKNKAISPEDVDSLRHMISSEKARLRWRLGSAEDEPTSEADDSERPGARIYEVFNAGLGS